MTDVAASREQSFSDDNAVVRRLRVAAEPAAVWLYGFLVIALVAGSTGGYLPTTQGWTAVITLWLAAIVLLLRDRIELGSLDLAYVGGLTAFTGWVALSNLWSPSMTSTMHEVQRDLAYVGVALAGLLVTNRRTVPHLLGGVLSGVALLCLYALGTRILPDRLGSFDSEGFGYRLAAPITYWNGLGIFSVMGILLTWGFVGRAKHLLTRGLSAAAIPLLATTMYFTFSRGAWAALGVGLVAAILADPRRLQLIATGLVLAPFAAIAIFEADSRAGLTTVGSTLGQAIDDGHSLVLPLLGLALLSGLAGLAVALVERYLPIPKVARIVFAGALVSLLIAGTAVVWTEEGSPAQLAERGWNHFQAAPNAATPDVSDRLLQVSNGNRIPLWEVSWQTFRSDPLLGTGAGTFWEQWVKYRDTPLSSAEGHSLYLEVLGELGLPGLLLLATALLAPFAAGVSSRSTGLVPPALGAYAAWAVHAGVDWDWELTGVSAVALLIGVALLRARSRQSNAATRVRGVLVAVVLVLSLVALAGLVGSLAIDSASNALGERDSKALSDLDRAARWAPWSSTVGELRANVWVGRDRPDLARAAYRQAIRKDPDSWLLWSALANVSTGAEKARALRQVERLNPLLN